VVAIVSNGRQKQRSPLRETSFQERVARELGEAGGKKLALHNQEGSGFP
jgi:hypothetical protein